MIEAKANPEAGNPAWGRRMAIGVAAACLMGGSIALWLRFGEGVYAQSLLNAVMACF
jgi:hypothetical protein